MIGVSKAEERECGTENNILRNVHGAATIENGMDVLQNLTTELPYGPTIPFLGIYPRTKHARTESKNLKRLSVYPCLQQPIHNSQKKQPKCPVNEWLNKCGIFTYKEILFSLTKEGGAPGWLSHLSFRLLISLRS